MKKVVWILTWPLWMDRGWGKHLFDNKIITAIQTWRFHDSTGRHTAFKHVVGMFCCNRGNPNRTEVSH